jgi:hypothetical protein
MVVALDTLELIDFVFVNKDALEDIKLFPEAPLIPNAFMP